jgi:hypothetical protein
MNRYPEDLSHYWTVSLLLPYSGKRGISINFEMNSYPEDLSHYWTVSLLLPLERNNNSF